MNVGKKEDVLLSTLNKVKNVEEDVKYNYDMSEANYFAMVRRALFEHITPQRRYECLNELIKLLNKTEDKKLVSLGRHLSVLMGKDQKAAYEKVDAMMEVRKAYKDSFFRETNNSIRKKEVLTTYKEYQESMRKSRKYGKDFTRRAKRVKKAREIYYEAEKILRELENSFGSEYEYNYASRSDLARNLRKISLISEYLATKEWKIEENQDRYYR